MEKKQKIYLIMKKNYMNFIRSWEKLSAHGKKNIQKLYAGEW